MERKILWLEWFRGTAMSVNSEDPFPDVIKQKKKKKNGITSGSKNICSQHLAASPSVMVNSWVNEPAGVWGFSAAAGFCGVQG